MPWNHRIIRKTDPNSSEVFFEIHEVYYKASGEIEGWTESAVVPFGTSTEELESCVRLLLQAFGKPVLEVRMTGGVETLAEIDLP